MTTATATKPLKGFKVICPFCGDQESTVKLDLNDLKACYCTACDEEFSPRDAMEKAMAMASQWEAVVQWIEMASQVG